MMRWTSAAAAALLLSLAGPVGAAEPESKDKPGEGRKMTPDEKKALQAKLIATINGKGPQLDRCVTKHMGEFPKAKGTVKLTITVERDGKVSKADATTSLKGARNLRPCIAKVGRSYVFPAPNTVEPTKLSLSVPVEKGAKFKVYAEGEAPKPKPGSTTPPSVVRFNSGVWFPGW